MLSTIEILKRAVNAKTCMNLLTEDQKNQALLKMAEALEEHAGEILAENEKDLENARGTVS